MMTDADIPGGYRDANRVQLQRLELALKGEGNGREENMAANRMKQLALHDDWKEKIPEVVQSLADDYVSALTKKKNAGDKFTSTRDELCESMREHGVSKVCVQYKSGEKIIEIDAVDKLKLRKIKKAEMNGEVEDD